MTLEYHDFGELCFGDFIEVGFFRYPICCLDAETFSKLKLAVLALERDNPSKTGYPSFSDNPS